MGNSSGGYPQNGDSFWPVTGPSAHRHRYGLAQVPTLGFRSIKTAVMGGTKVTDGTGICPNLRFSIQIKKWFPIEQEYEVT